MLSLIQKKKKKKEKRRHRNRNRKDGFVLQKEQWNFPLNSPLINSLHSIPFLPQLVSIFHLDKGNVWLLMMLKDLG